MEVRSQLSLQEKLRILSDAAKYDAACTSSGNDRAAVKGAMGSACASGICHAFGADGRCISLLKILLSNECAYDCKYCVNRRTNDVPRATFTPEEVCELTTEFYRRNYIEGLFLSSGILKSPTYTMEQMYKVLSLLRNKYRFMGYIHVKGIPGTDQVLLEKIGFLADRMSLNLELPTSAGLKKLAPAKKEENILKPMKHIQAGIHGNSHYGLSAYQTTRKKMLPAMDIHTLWESAIPKEALPGSGSASVLPVVRTPEISEKHLWLPDGIHKEDRCWLASGKLSGFVPAGQSTQMIIGATAETDLDIIGKAETLYRGYDLKRVFYSAFINTTHDSALPETPDGPPLLREHRLYQADFLLRYYGFSASELLSPERPNLHLMMDPKCGWALRHLGLFPVEVSRADYSLLMRVPGIGMKSAERIIKARKTTPLSFESLKRMGVVLKRAHYFILCNGRQMFPTKIDERFITDEILSMDREKNWLLARKENYRQISLFSDYGLRA